MKILARRIKRKLEKRTERNGHYAIYEDQLQRIWPLNEENRKAKIEQFAKEYGFKLSFYKQGLAPFLKKNRRASRRGASRKRLISSSLRPGLPRRSSRSSSIRLIAALCFRHERDGEQEAHSRGAGHEQKRAGTAYMVADIAGDCGAERGAHAHCGADYALRQIVMASAAHDIGKDERNEHGKRCGGYAIEQLDCDHEKGVGGHRKKKRSA